MPNFDFSDVSPRVILNEIDQSILPPVPPKDGLLLIGRARRGPGMKPITVNSLDEFVNIFGNPIDGTRQNDPWRQGNTGAPNYAAYAAQAYLAADVGPVKYIRLLGKAKNDTNKAGWTLGSTMNKTAASNKAAYGLFLAVSGGSDSYNVTSNATLAAVFYTNGAGIALDGKTAATGSSYGYATTMVSASTVIESTTHSAGFTLVSFDGTTSSSYNIDFDPNSRNYIRNVMNTDPTSLVASNNYAGGVNESFFLGETFDVNVERYITSISSSAATVWGWIAGLQKNTDNWDNHQADMAPAKTGWFRSSKGSGPSRFLFRLIALDDGVDFQNSYYCQIANLSPANTFNPQATFTLRIMKRKERGPDENVEEFTNLTLDPTSGNFIARRIGDSNEAWNFDGRYTEQGANGGTNPNRSAYVRVEMSTTLTTAEDLPLGFLGPVVESDLTITPAMANSETIINRGAVYGGKDIAYGNQSNDFLMGWPMTGTAGFGAICNLQYPRVKLTITKSNGGSDFPANSYFGMWHKRTNETRTNPSIRDCLRPRVAYDMHIADGGSLVSASYQFSLEDIVSSSAGATTYYYDSGSYDRTAGAATQPSIAKLFGLTGSSGLLEGLKIRQYSCPFFGGDDGTNILYQDPFSNYQIGLGADKYPAFAVEQAIKMVEDPEQIKYELISIPGLVNSDKVDSLLKQTEDRGDALAIVDVNGIARAAWDANGTEVSVAQNTAEQWNDGATAILATSYGATYFPNILLTDTLNGNRTRFTAPPSVAGIGGIAQSEAASQPWFAPAGFNRGGLNRLGGNDGPLVVGSSLHLNRDDRDDLYKVNINPIARFPSTGDTVIFGQKTMMGGSSALNRINVRRLMIYLKRQIGVIADTILFDQNVEVTWNRFKARAEEVLSEVKSELGVTDYKVILDSSTTTAEAIDRNVMYAQILVKPARAIEYIVVDFIITRSGVEF